MKLGIRTCGIIFFVVISALIVQGQPQIDWATGGRLRNTIESAEFIGHSANQTYLTSIQTHDGESFTFGLARLSQSGELLWGRFYDYEGRNRPDFLSTTDDGGCFIGTFTGWGEFPNWCFRLDANGDTLWSKQTADLIYDIFPVGDRFIEFGGIGDSYIALKDSTGEVYWNAEINACRPVKVYPAPDYGYYALGLTGNPFMGGGMQILGFLVAKIDLEGQIFWIQRHYVQMAGVEAILVQLNNEMLAVAYNPSPLVMILSEEGDSLTTLQPNIVSGVELMDKQITGMVSPDGADLVLAVRYEEGPFNRTVLHRMTFGGDSIWTLRTEAEHEFLGYSVLKNDDHSYTLAGQGRGFYDDRPGWVVLQTTPDNANSVEFQPVKPHPSALILHPCFPNPFNSSTTITYDVARPGFVRLGVYDALGRLVGTVKEGYAAPGRHYAEWNAGELAGGGYFVKLYSESKTPASVQVELVK